MSVSYHPATVKEYYELTRRLGALHEEYDAIEDSDKASAFHEEHWADLKAHVYPPPLNALILAEWAESHERVTRHIARALGAGAKVARRRNLHHLVEIIEAIEDDLTRPPTP